MLLVVPMSVLKFSPVCRVSQVFDTVNPMKSSVAIPRAYAQMLVEACQQHGHSVEALLDYSGISPELWQGGGDISAVHFGRLYQRMLWLMRDESFGMILGKRVPNGSFRMMCLSVIHCRTLREVILRAAGFCDVAIGYQVKPVLDESGDRALIRMEPTPHATDRGELNSRQQLARARTMLLMWHNFLGWLAGRTIPTLAVHFCHPEAEPGELLHFSPQIIKRGMPEDGLAIAPQALRWPVVQTEASLEEFLANALYHLICAQPNMGSCSARVSDLIAQAPALNRLRAADVASALACSEATLRRRLANEDTSFQTLKDQYRQSAALRNLSTSRMPLKEVASLCGFDNTAEFNRAFRRWTGDTPGNYRKKLQPPL